MHELGHNLGLLHGGPQKQVETGFLTSNAAVNCKPNYYSVMNYALQTPAFNALTLDYSRGQFVGSDINESSLDETSVYAENFGGPLQLVIGTPSQSNAYDSSQSSGVKIDWNNDGDTNDNALSGINADVNNLGITGCDTSEGETLKDNEDWSNLVYDFRTINGGSFDGTTPLDEETLEIVEEIISNLPDRYDGLLKHHVLSRTVGVPTDINVLPGNVFDLGQVAWLSFQFLSCDPTDPVAGKPDKCFDRDGIVKQSDFYITNEREDFTCNPETDEDCELLTHLTGRILNAEITKVGGGFATTIEFHEASGDKGFYFIPWDTSEGDVTEGTYRITITDEKDFPQFDANQSPIFKAENTEAPFEQVTLLVEILG